MSQRIACLLLTTFCLTATEGYALEADKQQAISQACGLTAGRQQQYVMTQLPGAVPTDKASLAQYRDVLRYSSYSARNAIRIARSVEPTLAALDDHSFNDAVNLGIVLQSEPAIIAQATGQIPQQKQVEVRSDSEQLGALREAWTGLCLQQLRATTTLARRRELSLCNTYSVIGLMQRQRFEPTLKGKASREQIEALLKTDADARSMIDDTLALTWVDDEMKSAAIQRGAILAAEASPQDVSGFRELAQQLAKDPLRLPYGGLCEAMASGARPVQSSQPAGALVEVKAKTAVTFRPNLTDFYPPESIRTQQEGHVGVSVCFDATGKVTRSTVQESSGSAALDEAGVKYGMLIQFKPALVDFVPQVDCALVPVFFNLK